MFFPLTCSHKDFLYLPLLQCIVVLSLCFFSKCLHGFVVFWVEAVTLLSLNCCQFGNSITWDSWILHTSHQSVRQSVTGMYCFYLDGQTRRTIGGKIWFFFFFLMSKFCPVSSCQRQTKQTFSHGFYYERSFYSLSTSRLHRGREKVFVEHFSLKVLTQSSPAKFCFTCEWF